MYKWTRYQFELYLSKLHISIINVRIESVIFDKQSLSPAYCPTRDYYANYSICHFVQSIAAMLRYLVCLFARGGFAVIIGNLVTIVITFLARSRWCRNR